MDGRWQLRWAMRLLGPVLLLVVVLRLPRPAEVWGLIVSSALAPLVAAMALNLVSLQLKVVRWQTLLRAREIEYPWRQALPAFSASQYLGMLTPGRVGDVLRVQYLRHDLGTPYAEGLASVVLDRVCDLYVLVGFFAIAVMHFGAEMVPGFRWAAAFIVLGVALGPAVLLAPGLADRLLRAIYRRITGGTALELDLFLTSIRAQARGSFIVALPLTLVAYLIGFGQAWLVADAMAIRLSYFDIACLTAIATMISFLPISISGLGVRESFFAAVFPLLGYRAERGVAYGLCVFALLYLAVAAIGFVAWQVRPPPMGASRGATT